MNELIAFQPALDKEQYGILDTGKIMSDTDHYREFYVTDSSKKELKAVHTTIWDHKTGGSYNLAFYFLNGRLIKVYSFETSGHQKQNIKSWYYLQGNCKDSSFADKEMLLKLHYLRLAESIKVISKE
jgi:hypothetical protein